MRNSKNVLLAGLLALSSLGFASVGAAEPRKEVRLDYADYSPVSLILRKFGWIEAALAAEGIAVEWQRSESSEQALTALSSATIDFGSVADIAATRARAHGDPIKAVFVYAGAPVGGYGLLSVREEFAAAHPMVVGQVLKTYDRARKWLVAHPAEAAQIVASESKLSIAEARAHLERSDFSASAPGPAQVAAIRAAFPVRVGGGSDPAEALIDRATARAALSAVRSNSIACGSFCDHW